MSTLEHRGLTLEELAEMLGLDPGSLSSWETGERRPDKRSRAVIERFIGAVNGHASDSSGSCSR
ncbi:MAG: helix-turn-helix domain-containing protein [Gammaproteobacteria bacterium]